MNAIRSVKNQYLGINAHLHSMWQESGGWNNFLSRHIGDLAALMRQQLLLMGYTALIEKSLQIRRWGSDAARSVRADVVVGDLHPAPALPVRQALAGQITVAEMIEEEEVEKPYNALAIYQQDDPLGEPVAWIELLSPTNKGLGRDAQTYLSKRHLILEAGTVFVELDYLHETPPTFSRLGNYTNPSATDAHPWRVVILDPRPDIHSGPVFCYEFDVDDPLPTVVIALNGDDSMDFDFGAAYRRSYEEMMYGLESVDYSQLPINFDHYHHGDPVRIARRMLAVLEAHQAGVDLETGPFPVKDVSIETALSRIEALKQQR